MSGRHDSHPPWHRELYGAVTPGRRRALEALLDGGWFVVFVGAGERCARPPEIGSGVMIHDDGRFRLTIGEVKWLLRWFCALEPWNPAEGASRANSRCDYVLTRAGRQRARWILDGRDVMELAG